MATGIANSLGGVFGSALASKIITPETPQAAIFASAGSALGSLGGTLLAQALLSGVPFVGPFLGAFFGQMVGTAIGNWFTDYDAHAHYYIQADAASGRLVYAGSYGADGGDVRIANAIGTSVQDTVNATLGSLGLRLNPNVPLTYEVGYLTEHSDYVYAFANSLDPAHKRVFGYKNHDWGDEARRSAFGAVAQIAIEEIIDSVSVVGGDPVIRRAFNASRAASDTFGESISLGFDLQVAKDYRYYLENTSLINALIAAAPSSQLAMSWVITLQRANELGLNNATWDEFRGGFFAHLVDRGLGDKINWTPDIDPAEHDTLVLRHLNHTVSLDNVFGPGMSKREVGTSGADTVDFWLDTQPYSVRTYDGGAGNDVIAGGNNTEILV